MSLTSQDAPHGLDTRLTSGVSRRAGAASHNETGWADAAGTPRLQPTCCAIFSRSDPSRSHRRPGAPSKTYFPHENCVFLRMTEGSPQSSAGDRSSRSRSKFPILRCAPPRELSWMSTSEETPGETVMPALTATSALVGAMVLLGLWSGRRWGRRRKRVLDAEARRFRTRRGS